MSTVNITGTGGIIEGNLGAANVNVNLDSAYVFDGVDDNVNVGNHPSYANGTIAFWAKCEVHDGNHRRIIEDRGPSGGTEWIQIYSNASTDKMTWYMETNGSSDMQIASDATIPLNVWQHYAFVWGTGGRKMYVNGVIQNESSGESGAATNVTSTETWDSGSTVLEIAGSAYNDVQRWKGGIADVRVYNAVLGVDDIQVLASKINTDSSLGAGTTNLMGWWKLNNGSITDSGPTGGSYVTYNGDLESTAPTQDYDAFSVNVQDNGTTTDGAFTITQGKVECLALTSVDFDGSNDYINVGDASSFSFGDGSNDEAFSISAWINMDDATSFPILSKGVYNTNAEWNFKTESDDKLYLILYDESVSSTQEYACTTATLTAHQDKWIHVTATYNGVGGTSANAGIKLYVNGVAEAMTLGDAGTYVAMENLAASIHIGRYDSQYANGSIRDVRIYGQELSADQVASLYSNTLLQTPQQHFELNQAASPFPDTGTSNAGQGYQNGGATVVNGTLDLDSTVTIQTNGTLSAPRGTMQVTGASSGSNWMVRNGTFTHNNGTVDFIAPTSNASCILSSTMTGANAFYDLHATTSTWLRIDSDIDIHHEAANGYVFWLYGGVVTMGTDDYASGTDNSDNCIGYSYIYGRDGNTYLYGANQLKPYRLNLATGTHYWITSGHNSYMGDATHVKWGNMSGTLTMAGTADAKLKLMGDMEFDAVTVGDGDTLDLNGQRAELSGVLSVPSGGTLDADGLLFASNIDIDSSTPTNITSCNAVLTGSGTVDNENSSGLFNTLMFNGTGKFQPNNGHMLSATNVIIANEVDCNVVDQNSGAVNITVPTGGALDGDSATITLAGDFTTSGGLIGKSALSFPDGGDSPTGAGNALDVPYDLVNLTGDATIEFWMKADANTNANSRGVINGYKASVANRWQLYQTTSNNLTFYSHDYNKSITVTCPTGKWSHVAIVCTGTGGDVKLYIDGKLEGQTELGSGVSLATSGAFPDFGVNRQDGSTDIRTNQSIFEGELAMLRIWTDERTESELRANMFATYTNLASNTDCAIAYEFDEGTGTDVDDKVGSNNGTLINSVTWAGAGTFTYGNSTLKMTGTSKKINYTGDLSLYNLTIATGGDSNAITMNDINGNNSGLLIYGTIEQQSGKLASTTSEYIQIGRTFGDVKVASGKGAIAFVDIDRWYIFQNSTSGTKNFPHADSADKNLTINDMFITSSSTIEVLAGGNLTFPTRLRVEDSNTFNANGNTIDAKEIDINGAGTLNLSNSTLQFKTSGSNDQLNLENTATLLTGNTTIEGYNSANHTWLFAPATGGFEVVGSLKYMELQNDDGDITVIGSVTDCSFEDGTTGGNFRQWHHTLDTQQLLDADEAGDDDMKLPKPSLDNAHELQLGG